MCKKGLLPKVAALDKHIAVVKPAAGVDEAKAAGPDGWTGDELFSAKFAAESFASLCLAYEALGAAGRVAGIPTDARPERGRGRHR